MSQVLNRSRTRIAAVLLLCSSLLLSGVATDYARAGETASDRAHMLRLTNRAREDNDHDALALNRKLSRCALRHSRRMAEEGELFHTNDLADKMKGLNWSMGGENVGVAASLDDVQAAFMGSEPHRDNILCDEYDHTAIGVVQSDGNLWVTVIFYG